ncbi:MAG: aminopeptidase [Candidatus Methanofastidiosia archaeon]
MADQYIEKLAKVITNYSIDIKKDDEVAIVGNTVGEPLMMEIFKEVLKLGAHPNLFPQFAHSQEIFFKHADSAQISHPNLFVKLLYENVDRIINVWADVNTKNLTNVPPDKLAEKQAANKDLVKIFFDRETKGELKWSLTAYPTDSMAQEASMSLEEYSEFVYKAGLLDKDDPVGEWKKISKKQEKICNWLDKREEFRFVGLDTDLAMSCKGRKWINCDGKKNFPDGEVFTGPIEDTPEGEIRFTYPMIYMGNEIEDVKLRFKDGAVVDATASKGENFLKKILETDKGTRYMGEIAIGTNYGIKTFTKNMLFDEKIGGTMHLALGRSIPESGGKNMSVLHIDILKDMKDGGKIYADGELFYENGKFLI